MFLSKEILTQCFFQFFYFLVIICFTLDLRKKQEKKKNQEILFAFFFVTKMVEQGNSIDFQGSNSGIYQLYWLGINLMCNVVIST